MAFPSCTSAKGRNTCAECRKPWWKCHVHLSRGQKGDSSHKASSTNMRCHIEAHQGEAHDGEVGDGGEDVVGREVLGLRRAVGRKAEDRSQRWRRKQQDLQAIQTLSDGLSGMANGRQQMQHDILVVCWQMQHTCMPTRAGIAWRSRPSSRFRASSTCMIGPLRCLQTKCHRRMLHITVSPKLRGCIDAWMAP